jgi:hypothetical protein
MKYRSNAMPSQRSLEAHERSAALRRKMSAETAHDTAAEAGAAPHPLVALQRQVGNAEVSRMLGQRAAEEEEVQEKHDLTQRESDDEEMKAKHDLTQREGDEEEADAKHDFTQREGDEEEADAKHDLTQRAADEEEADAKHDLTQREGDAGAAAQPEVGLEGGALSDGLSARINSRRGGGQSLDDGTRSTMENSFGTSFKDVRVHTDAESDALNRSISAKAFTTGSDIFFRRDTSPGDHSLLAHELTHVVQQRSGSGGGGGGMRVGPAGDSHEVAADSMSTAVTSGVAAQAQREADEAAAQRAVAQRQAAEEEEQAQ